MVKIICRIVQVSRFKQKKPKFLLFFNRRWETRAVELFRYSLIENKEKQTWLLTRENKYWPGLSALEISFLGKCYRFVDDDFVQLKLTHMWTGRVASSHSLLTVAISSFLMPCIWLVIRFVPFDPSGKLDSNKSKKGIKYSLTKNEIAPESPKNGDSKNEINGNEKRPFHEVGGIFRAHQGKTLKDFGKALEMFYKSPARIRFWANVIVTVAFQLSFTTFILSGRMINQGFTTLELIILGWCACFLIDYLFDRWSSDLELMDRNKLSIKDKIKLFWQYRIQPIFQFEKGLIGLRDAISLEVIVYILMVIFLITAPLLK